MESIYSHDRASSYSVPSSPKLHPLVDVSRSRREILLNAVTAFGTRPVGSHAAESRTPRDQSHHGQEDRDTEIARGFLSQHVQHMVDAGEARRHGDLVSAIRLVTYPLYAFGLTRSSRKFGPLVYVHGWAATGWCLSGMMRLVVAIAKGHAGGPWQLIFVELLWLFQTCGAQLLFRRLFVRDRLDAFLHPICSTARDVLGVTRRAQAVAAVGMTLYLANLVLIGIAVAGPFEAARQALSVLVYPLNGTFNLGVAVCIFSMAYTTAAWIFPSALFCWVASSQSMHYNRISRTYGAKASWRAAASVSSPFRKKKSSHTALGRVLVEEVQTRHDLITRSVKAGNSIFCPWLLLIFCTDIPLLIIITYMLAVVRGNDSLTIAILCFWKVTGWLHLLVPVKFAWDVNVSSRTILLSLLDLDVQRQYGASAEYKQDLVLFIARLNEAPVGYSAWFVTITQEVIMSIFGVFTTYLVVLLTFPSN
eukprot:jgi/Mesvir1/7415/Mv19201-RA.1